MRCPDNCRDFDLQQLLQCLHNVEPNPVVYYKMTDLIFQTELKMYASTTNDIRKCPSENCSYFGYVVKNELLNCQESLRCELCFA